MPKSIHAVCVVQNEEDIVAESVKWALRFCECVWVWDLASTDRTWDILQGLACDRVKVSRREGLRFTSSVKGRVFAAARQYMKEGSWVYILDVDEFLCGDPDLLLTRAEEAGASLVGAWQVNFFPTGLDITRIGEIGEEAWSRIPIMDRLRFYRVEWFEWRFVRIVPGFVWDTSGNHSKWFDACGGSLGRFRRPAFVRHYRYRSPSQVAARFRTRKESVAEGYGQFRYDSSSRFEDYVQPLRKVAEWNDSEPVPGVEVFRAALAMQFLRLKRRLRQRVFGR